MQADDCRTFTTKQQQQQQPPEPDEDPELLKVSDLETFSESSDFLDQDQDRTPFCEKSVILSDDEPLRQLPPRENASASPRQTSRVDPDIFLTRYRHFASLPASAAVGLSAKSRNPDPLLPGGKRAFGLELSRKRIQFEMDESKRFSSTLQTSMEDSFRQG